MTLTTFNVNGWVFCRATTVSLKDLFGGALCLALSGLYGMPGTT